MQNDKQKFFYKKVQLITSDNNGKILFSDANLFPWKVGEDIYEAHPFFEIIKSLKESTSLADTDNEYSFSCVHLNASNSEKERICDVTITIELAEVQVILLDYTEAYRDLNKISQERNESIIRTQELEFENKLLVEKEAFKNDFIASINHEISTPLTSIKGFLEVLGKTELNYEQEEVLKIIKTESIYLESIFNDLLNLSKIQAGTFKIQNENFDFLELLDSIKDSFKGLAEQKMLDFSVTIDSKVKPGVFGDKTRIYQIVNNLLANALKYTDEGYINFSVKKIGGKNKKQEIEIIVEDSGRGISEEHLSEIYEAFTQFGNSESGSGLGLHIVRSLVSLMGGTIEVTSELNKGTKFTVVLGLKHQKIEGHNDSKKRKYVLPKGKKYRVLIVENKLNTQYLIMRNLLDQKCFFVDAVQTAEEALEAIERRNYDLMILDIKLPGKSGLELTELVRNDYEDAWIKNLPILGISSISTPSIVNKVVAAGMNSFLSKPFSEEVLIQKVSRLLTLDD